MTRGEAQRLGYDAGRNGPNTTNCHFSIFSAPEFTRAWEIGNQAGLADRGLAMESPQSGSVPKASAEQVKE